MAKDFASAYEGKLGDLAGEAEGGARLAKAITDYEALDEILGRLGSYAQLFYVGDTTDPARAKFFGDTSQKLNDIGTGLLFFELELNRIDDEAMRRALIAPELKRYEPVDHQPEEGNVPISSTTTAKNCSTKNRSRAMPHGTGCSTRPWPHCGSRSRAKSSRSSRRSTLLMIPKRKAPCGGAKPWRKPSAEILRLFTHITNTLAKDKEISDRWRGFKDIADARHLSNRVEPEVVAALVEAVRAAYPRLSHRYYALKAKWFGKEKLDHWDRNAPVPEEDTRMVPWGEAREIVLESL